ncbi:unnamed protein product [Darwinula stevensoni]|uniref:Uncharacterized protein n=1 Tax=Darwinula stevensoni TaxID=69355 RepID=A0A7R9A918_9CRUS|nr:unnamed protein product [Darwinula stevensoni]CAG0896790.1 unnamed protein product [Darwinula stevensoni]
METQFKLERNIQITELSEEVLGNISLQIMTVNNTVVKRIHPSVIAPSEDRLSESLQLLSISRNDLSRVDENGWETPNLTFLDMGYNPLPKFPSSVIKSLSKLQTFLCPNCNLGPTLTKGMLEFHSKTLGTVSLWNNGISIMESEAITGVTAGTTIFLSGNNISTLEEEIFRPILEVISKGRGFLYIHYNPIQCDCSLAWLALRPELLRKVQGRCASGQFELSNSMDITELSDDVFGDLSFQVIMVGNTAVKRIHPSVILSSEDRLVNFTIRNSPLEEFPFYLLPRFPRLKILSLVNNSLTSVPELRSESLQLLSISRNKITRLEENAWVTPNLKFLDIGDNPLSGIPSAVIMSLEKLEKFWCSGCNLGPTISTGVLQFQSEALKMVSLWSNGISGLEPKAITGIKANTEVHLTRNKIATLNEETFRPILEIMPVGMGFLDLKGKPVTRTSMPNANVMGSVGMVVTSLGIISIVVFIVSSISYYRIRKTRTQNLVLIRNESERFRRGQPENINPSLGLSEQADLLPYYEDWEFPPEKLRLDGENDSGNEILAANKQQVHSQGKVLPRTFSTSDLVSWAYQISQGMEYLVSQKRLFDMNKPFEEMNAEFFEENKGYLRMMRSETFDDRYLRPLRFQNDYVRKVVPPCKASISSEEYLEMDADYLPMVASGSIEYGVYVNEKSRERKEDPGAVINMSNEENATFKREINSANVSQTITARESSMVGELHGFQSEQEESNDESRLPDDYYLDMTSSVPSTAS